MKKRPRPRRSRSNNSKGESKDTWGDLSALAGGSAGSLTVRFSSIPPLQRASALFKGLRLLVVDDEPARLDAFAMALRELGAQVAVGDRAEAGYAQAVRLVPDVIISDLVNPKEPGWRLVHKLRRHPLLRWSPVLLLRWWKQRDDKTVDILIDSVAERLEEIMAPHRGLAERILSTHPFSERLDLVGPPALLRLLADSGTSGTLTLNDAWSVFEVGFTSGRIHSVVRRGLSGGVDSGADAFLQLMLSDSGRWTLRKQQNLTGPNNIDEDLGLNLERAAHVLGALFGFDGPHELRRPQRLKVNLDALTEAASTYSVLALRVVNALRGKSPESELDRLLEGNPDELGGVVTMFFCCGAVRLQRKKTGDIQEETQRDFLERLSSLLEGLGERRVARGERNPQELAPPPVPSSPGVTELRTAVPPVPRKKPVGEGRAEPMANWAPKGETTQEGRDAFNPLGEPKPDKVDFYETTQPPKPGTLELSNELSARPTVPDEDSRSSVRRPVSGPEGHKMNRLSMWLAIGLSLLLGAVILFGLVLIASDEKGPALEAGETAEPANGEPGQRPPDEASFEGGRLAPLDEGD